DDEHRRVAIDLPQVGEEIEALVIGPVQVLELEHDGQALCAADPAKELRRGMKGAVADLLRVVEDALDVAALAPLDADQVPEQVGMPLRGLRTVVLEKKRHDALLELAAGRLDAVVVGDAKAPGEDVA